MSEYVVGGIRVTRLESKTGNGRLQLSARELADVNRLVASLIASLQRRLPRGLEVRDLELEIGRRPTRPARSD